MSDEEGRLHARLRQVAERRGETEGPAAARRYEDASRRRLLAILSRKMKTAFIGALARFEQAFGPALWGHGLPEASRTPAQRAARAEWERCRTEVLNNGNGQLRAVENEVSQYTVRWDRHRATLPAAGGRGAGGKEGREGDGNG